MQQQRGTGIKRGAVDKITRAFSPSGAQSATAGFPQRIVSPPPLSNSIGHLNLGSQISCVIRRHANLLSGLLFTSMPYKTSWQTPEDATVTVAQRLSLRRSCFSTRPTTARDKSIARYIHFALFQHLFHYLRVSNFVGIAQALTDWKHHPKSGSQPKDEKRQKAMLVNYSVNTVPMSPAQRDSIRNGTRQGTELGLFAARHLAFLCV
jgi:hypothetical protein